MTEPSTPTDAVQRQAADPPTAGSDAAVLAIDVGGTKMAVGVVDSSGRVMVSERVPTRVEPDDGADTIWRRLADTCQRVLGAAGSPELQGVGVGCGGPMRWPEGAVSPLNLVAWRDFPLRDRLRAEFSGLPVRVHNDAIAVVVAEHWLGAGRGEPNMLGMVVSTGVGGGLILGDRLIDGASGNAGHVGHIVVEPDGGPPCGCGGHGCVEAVARGPAIAQWARDRGWRPDDQRATARELAADARAGDPVATAAFARAGRAVGIGIASAVALCDVSRVVVGGGVSQAGDLLFGPLQEAYDEYARMEFTRSVSIGRASLDQDAGLVGAAAFILDGEQYWSPGR